MFSSESTSPDAPSPSPVVSLPPSSPTSSIDRDELQTENEELSIVNAQLQAKIEELGRVQQAQHQSEERLRLLIESARDYAIFTLDNERRVNSWNTGAQAIFAYSEEEILGQLGDILFVPEDRDRHAPEGEAEKARNKGRAENERWHLRKDGSRFYGSGLTMPLREEDGTLMGFVKIMRDLTKHKQAEDALRTSEEQLRLAVESARLGVCDWNYQTGEMHGNAQRFLLMGLDPDHAVLTVPQFQSSLHPDDRERTWNALIQQIEERGQHAEEYRIVHPDGGVRWIAETGRVVEWHKNRPVRIASIVWDVTARHEAEEVLRRSHEELETLVQARTHELEQALAERTQLMRRIVNTQEEERGRISRELHDNLGQHLTAVMLGLGALEMQIKDVTGGKRQHAVPQLDNLRTLVDGLMKAAHRQAWELRPAELDALGLEAALRQYLDDWSKRTDMEVDFYSEGWEERPSPEVETTLYRVVQEALTNVARHAQATYVSVVLEQTASTVSAIIEDNGCGFDTEQSSGRLGVLGMQERLAIVGGTLEIESIPGDGTSVFARVPLS